MRLVAGALLLGVSAPAFAEKPSCELHVWPSAPMTEVRQRASDSMINRGGMIDTVIKSAQSAAAEKGNERAGSVLQQVVSDDPLSPEEQGKVITKLSLQDLLGLAGYQLVVHPEPLDSRTIRTVKGRYDPVTTAHCYADVVVDDLVYSREFSRGQNLKTLVRFRDFGSGSSVLRSFGTLVETKLLLFSLDPPAVTGAAIAELVAAYRNNLVSFANLAARKATATKPQVH